MTDEEIRALLDGRAAPLSQESATTRLQAAAPELAREVLRLRAELADAERRIARLERILAVEQGDELRAPEGWRFDISTEYEWSHKGRDLALLRGRRHWYWRWGGVAQGSAPTALEAMEAADLSAEENP